MNVPGDTDAKEIEAEHGAGEHAHAEGVLHGADDGGDEEDSEDRVAPLLEEELVVNDAEEREEEHDDGQFKADAEAENDGEKEAGVVLNGDHVGEIFADVLDEEDHGAGQDPAIAEPGSGEEEADGGAHEGDDVALLVRVHAGGDEEPELVEDEGARKDGAEDEGGFDDQVEGVGGVGHGHLEADVEQRPLDEVEQLVVEPVGDGHAEDEVDRGADEAFAELVEMLHEGHAGEVGAVGYGGAGLVDEVRHGWRARARRRGLGCGGWSRRRCLRSSCGLQGGRWRGASC